MGEPEYGEAFAFAVPSWRSLGMLALGAVALVLVFGIFADFDRVATVRGAVVPASGVSRLVAPQPGIVAAVLARQGAAVEAGEPLVRIASADSLPSGAAASAEVLEGWRRQQRVVDAERIAARERRESERERLSQSVAELAAAIGSLRSQAALQRERIANNERRLSDLSSLRVKGYVSAVAYDEQEEAVLTLRQQLAALNQRQAEAEHGLAAARLRLAELAAEARQAELRSASALLELERGAAGAQIEAEVTLASPIAGRVAAMRAEPGMAVSAAEELATIVRPGDAMEVLLYVPPAAAGSIEPGQEVALRYDAFPYQRYGVGRGVVTGIAATATAEGPDAAPTYRVRVRLADGARFPLRSDMTLSAAITLERRSLLDWLLAPLRERWRESRYRAAA